MPGDLGLSLSLDEARRRRRASGGGLEMPGAGVLYSHIAPRLGYTTPGGVMTVPDRGSLGGSFAALSAAESPTVTQVNGLDALQYIVEDAGPPAVQSSRMQHSAAASAFNLLHNGTGSIFSTVFVSPAVFVGGTPGIWNTYRGGTDPGMFLRRSFSVALNYVIRASGSAALSRSITAAMGQLHVLTARVRTASPQVRVLFNGALEFEVDTTGLAPGDATKRAFTGEGPFSALDWDGIQAEVSVHQSADDDLQDDVHAYHRAVWGAA